jgi:predicted aldo/keto reductase-like oxidoreductase
MPVITCGGMRYQASWNPDEVDTITPENQANLAATLQRATELGITHIETARGYGTSEEQIGRVLASGQVDRKKVILQTKLGVTETGAEWLDWFEQSLQRLQTDRIDLLAIHGLNNFEVLKQSTGPGGPLDAAEKLKRQGRAKHIGFSTHGPADVLLEAVRTNRFDYINLHWYWIFQDNWPVIIEARRRDMGVFIISPSDKGGKLYEPPQTLVDLCKPLDPMVFNDCWCLLRGEVHTLSIGASGPEDFDTHIEAVERLQHPETVALVSQIDRRLNDHAAQVLGADWWNTWSLGIPAWQGVPGQVNVRMILRLWNLAKAFDMVEYGKMRYNLLGNGGHWFPGGQLGDVAPAELDAVLAGSPHRGRILQALAEAHEMLKGPEVKRLQEDR